MATIGFIGSGNMAEALIKGIINSGLYRVEDIYISDISADRVDQLVEEYGVWATTDNEVLAGQVETLVLSVKPQNMTDALESIANSVKADTLVISIAAGVTVEKMSAVLGDLAIVRVMPNTPALIGEGASALYANEKAQPKLENAEKIFSAVGQAVVVEEEGLIDAVTAVSGSGPAYYFLLTEEIIKAAVELGLPEEIATSLVLQTAKGSAILASEAAKRGEGPADLRRKVTSPGGTTEAALKILSDGKIGKLISAALAGARDRSRELSK